ncbi:unnamed protein product [Miscanthus lutarioriparius]|uniref:Uncharacterized protein n=1 Tax=Miscanthus lutarioriparius TaxID=422564 RepID=A0A811Q3F3_9POAL|nr:unnamed protein product [Miscanthus lutarioriparius]
MQSHVNGEPRPHLAHLLARLNRIDGRSILATLSVSVTAQRCLFPSPDSGGDEQPACSDGVISYVHHSDGFDDGATAPKTAEDWARRHRVTAESLSSIVAHFAAGGKPITCIVFMMAGPTMVDVARSHSIPFVVSWIRPATVLDIEYHYFHGGYRELITGHATGGDHAHKVSMSLPGLSHPLLLWDFLSFLLDKIGSVLANALMEMFRELFESMDQWRPKVLVNTIEELEANVLAEMKRHLDVVTVGPMPTNVYLVEEEWEVGVRGQNSDGVVTRTELARCIELVMGDGAKAVAIRERMKELKEIAQAAASIGGSMDRNLRVFLSKHSKLLSPDTFCIRRSVMTKSV